MEDNEINPYEPPKSSLDFGENNGSAPVFFSTSTFKLIVMSFCTFGFYENYWAYKNFVLIKRHTNNSIWPIPRAIFFQFWVYSCVSYIKTAANDRNVPETLSAGFLGIAYFITSMLWRLPDPFWLLSMLTVFYLIPANQVALAVNKKNNSDFVNNSKFSLWNWVAIVVGSSLAIFVIAISFIDPQI